jgi:hypothetical protein
MSALALTSGVKLNPGAACLGGSQRANNVVAMEASLRCAMVATAAACNKSQPFATVL